MKQFIGKIVNKNRFNQEIRNLASLRSKVIYATFCCVIFFCLVLLPVRMYEGNTYIVGMLISTAAISFCMLYLLKRRKFSFAMTLLVVFVFTTVPYLHYIGEISYPHLVLIISLHGLVYLLILEKAAWSISLFVIANLIIVFLGQNQDGQLTELVLTLCIYFCFFYILRVFIIQLQSKLIHQNAEKAKLIQELSDKNKEIQRYADFIVHDIKAPLRNIKGFNQIIHNAVQQDPLLKEKTEPHFQFICSSMNTLEQLIEDLLTKSKIDSAKLTMEKINLETLMSSILANFKFENLP